MHFSLFLLPQVRRDNGVPHVTVSSEVKIAPLITDHVPMGLVKQGPKRSMGESMVKSAAGGSDEAMGHLLEVSEFSCGQISRKN